MYYRINQYRVLFLSIHNFKILNLNSNSYSNLFIFHEFIFYLNPQNYSGIGFEFEFGFVSEHVTSKFKKCYKM